MFCVSEIKRVLHYNYSGQMYIIFPKEHLHRLVRILYKIRKPHCRQRTGSPLFILLRAPQSPHRYSTPRNCSKDDTAAAGVPAEVVAVVVVVPFILLAFQ